MQEEEQLLQLTRMRRIATGLLLMMAAIFVLARIYETSHGYVSFVRAFAEAAMVGALADWFAVTALFRRPFGLPIPHTAIIPENKDRIGESVANFLEHNFMTREVLMEELDQFDFAGAAAHWLSQPENSRALAAQIVSGIPAVLHMVEDEDVGKFLQGRVEGAMKNVRLAPLLAEVLTVLIKDGRHQALFDHMIAMAGKALHQNRGYIRQQIHERSPRWIPRIIDEKIFERLLSEVQDILDEMSQEDSMWRERFQQSAEDLIEKLRSRPEYEQRFGSAIAGLFRHPLFHEYLQQVWQDVKGRLLADATSPESRTVAQLDTALRALSQALMQDLPVQQKLNCWLRSFAVDAITGHRSTIAGLVGRVIRKWDAQTVSRKFELYVGKDLQFIRINGTLVGGMVGLALHTVSLVL